MTKLSAVVANVDYFKTTVLKFKTFIYNRNGKIICNFLHMEGIPPPPQWGK